MSKDMVGGGGEQKAFVIIKPNTVTVLPDPLGTDLHAYYHSTHLDIQ